VYAKGFGVASVEGTDAVTPDHLFRVGSTTKMFVGAALVKLAEAGKLKLDEPLGKVIDGLPPAVAALTPHQLLTHTSGLADGNAMFGLHDDAALGAGIRTWKDDRLFTKTGDIYSYSNPGYWLSGYTAEKVAGKPFADTMADELFSPLGMKRTTFRPTLAMTYPLAQGHAIREGKPAVVRPAADNAATWPAGSMFTSGNDLARFVIAFLNGGKLDGKQVLSESLLKTLASPYVEVPGSRGHYGYGLAIQRMRGIDLVSHSGSREGYGSRMTMAPAHKFGVIVMANRSGAAMPRTVEKAAELALPLEPATKPKDEPKPNADELAKLAGVYRNGANSFELKLSDGKLTLRDGKKEAAVEALGGARFRPEGGEEFGVVTGKDGTTTYLFRGGRAFKKQAK
jgi:CubicO group peptidase (beta-lactamase class C family)